MKSLALIISIIFGLIAFTSLTEGHTVWIQNKLVVGTVSITTALTPDGGVIDEKMASAHKGYHLYIPEDKSTFYLDFDVLGSVQDLKKRGPFNNDQDSCWHYHGNSGNWDVFPCP
ncbi:unnamed protein product [Rhizophagus irregularis]|uniref:Uncharacterized protein n=1 Tax=Rhizophagus irregularis TaxID=588596 RepID=A0A2I1HG53_9GLOM|nr:hypothetical protein RhiirA4_479230 [Rhizophagus irregularis]CAB4404281.1 unnamed protein product [Rhizophagus irregularis]